MDCDGCTLCCSVLPVPSLEKAAGEPCKDCEHGKGCRVWSQRPDICRGFQCAYTQGKAHPDLRPDHCHVIFERLDGFMVGTTEPGHEDAHRSQVVSGQIISFLREGFSVVLGSFTDRKAHVFPAPGRTVEDAWTEFNRLRRPWQ